MVPVSEPVHSKLLSMLADPFATPSDTADTIGAGAKVRKPSSMSYFSSGFRDSREKNSKKQRPLVVVIPPTILLHQHGPLGHTLSFGSPQKLTQGIIMTLHPTMYTQLTAISREFNFPSIAGLCLYLHHTKNGITLTPRISDESWSLLWGPALGCQSSATPTVPIAGTIEFDIDLRQAKWYSSWLSSSSRDAFDIHHSGYPHTIASERNGDSRTFVSDEQLDDRRDTYMHYPSSSVSLRRHPPKKLCLVDRFDIPNAKPSLPSSSPSPEKAPLTIHAVSPIAQEIEPRTAIKSRVQSWRAGSALEPTPTSMIAAGQISLDPANIPNMMQIDISLGIGDVLNLEDYSYSSSSAGPKDSDSLVPGGSECQQSIHLEHRLRGSVNSTPSICTSFGPLGYDFDPNLDEIDYVPSPDLAQRAIESCPLTPMTATSWGLLPSSPPSPSCRSYAASVDIGDKHIFSPPLSATTATSWGPPLSNPPSPLVVSVPVTPDIGYRAIDDTVGPEPWGYSWLYYLSQMEPPRSSLDSQSRYPYIKIYASVYPFVDIYPELAGENLGEGHLQTADNWSNRTVTVTLNQYPAFNLYPSLYPFFVIYPTALKTVPASYYESSITRFCPQSYPMSSRGLTLTNTDPSYPIIEQEAHHPQLSEALETQPRFVHPLQYPIFDLYPAIYPHINLNPSIVRTNCPELSPEASLASVFSVRSYPTLVIYPPVYPHFNLYPSRLQVDIILSDSQNSALDVSLKPGYPTIRIYPAIYPHFDMYPTVLSFNEKSTASASTETYPAAEIIETVNVKLRPGYPTIVLYPALYPHFDIYPLLNGRLADLISASTLSYSDAHVTAMTDVRFKPRYPTIILYPALYPHIDIYPMLPYNERSVDQTSASNLAYSGAQRTETVDTRLKPGYPTIILYPALYPHLELYPMLPHNERYAKVTPASNLVYSDAQGTEMMDTRLKPGYPAIILYPALYPHIDLYPMLPHNERSIDQTSASNLAYSGAQSAEMVDTRLKPGYPTIILYPALYERYVNLTLANNLPYSDAQDPETVDVRLKHGYPTIILYPALYPHIDLYPMLLHNERYVNLTPASNLVYSDTQGTETVDVRLKPGYPTIILYPASYPHFDIYPILLPNEKPGILTASSWSWDTQVTGTVDLWLKLGYPTINPYPELYPHFDIYPTALFLEKRLPSIAANEDCSEVQISSVVDLRLKPGYPTILIYPAVYPHFEIYPRAPPLWPLSITAHYPCSHLNPIVNENICALATSVNGSNETSSKRRRTKSHRDLHDIVLSNAFVCTPSGFLQSVMASPLAVSSDLIQTQEILAAQNYSSSLD